MFVRLCAALGLVAMGAPAPAAIITPVPLTTLFSTGEGVAPGAADPHWAITQSSVGSYSPGQAFATSNANGAYPIQSGVWALNNFTPAGYPTNSQWIGPTANAGTNWQTSTWTYQTTFNLTGLTLATVNIKGAVAVDNSVKIYLNGAPVASFLQSDERGYTTHAFETQLFNLTGGFLPGLNTLTFDVQNGNYTNDLNAPTGLRVAMFGVGEPQVIVNAVSTPEPASTVALLAAATGLGAYVRRRRLTTG